MDRNVQAGLLLMRVQCDGDLLDGLVASVERRSHHDDHPDGVLVNELQRLFGVEGEAITFAGNLASLHVPVPAELVPAHLDVCAHDQVRLRGRLSFRLPLGPPSPLHGHAAQHAGLARSDGRGAHGIFVIGCVPELGDHAETSLLDVRGLRILVAIDHVLVERLHQELGTVFVHPGGDEGRKVQHRVSVEGQFVLDHLVGDIRTHPLLGDSILRDFTGDSARCKGGKQDGVGCWP